MSPPPDSAPPKAAGAAPGGDASAGAFGFFALLRRLERQSRGRPRIGRSQRTRDEYVRLGQDPYLAFPETEISEIALTDNRPRVRYRVLGFYGPHGALPLNTTEEVLQWFGTGDTAFVDFTDIFATRFQQLFYRSWADARAIAQFDHPEDDRFRDYLLGFAGSGTPAFQNRDAVNDTVKLRLVALAAGRVRSPVRLRQMLALHLKTAVEVEEMLPSWMAFEPDALSCLGQQGSTLGQDVHLGSRVRSIGEKICIHVRVPSLSRYRRFLPGGPDHAHLRAIVFWYLGQTFEIDVAVWLPQREVRAARIGESAEVGWMACIAPPAGGDNYVRGTLYRLDPEPEGAPAPQSRPRAA